MEGTYDFRKMYREIYADWSYGSGFSLDPEKTALVIVDLQPGLTSSKVGMSKAYGRLLKISLDYFDERVQRTVIPNVARLLEYFRANKMLVAYVVTWSETEDLSDMPSYQRRVIKRWEESLGEQVYRKWNPGMQIYDEIAPRDKDLVVPKRTGSAFASSMLDFCLRNAGIEHIVLTGCNTNGCVFETACVGRNFGYDLALVSDATACFSPVLQEQAEAWMERFFAVVKNTGESIQMLEEAKCR